VIDYGTDEVANHAFAELLLALNRKAAAATTGRFRRRGQAGPAATDDAPHRAVFAGTDTRPWFSFGAIARAVAKRALGFGMRVIAYDPYIDPASAAAQRVPTVENW